MGEGGEMERNKAEADSILTPKEIQLIKILKEWFETCGTKPMYFTTLQICWRQRGFVEKHLDEAIETLFELQMINYTGREATDSLSIICLKYEEPIKLFVSDSNVPYIIVVSDTWKEILEQYLKEAQIPITCVRQCVTSEHVPSEYNIDLANGVELAEVKVVIEKCYEYGLREYKEER